ncbi:sulfotransferase 6B1-like isoform X2 [Pithys albifrons albifrons]|uniref:sulfotransferase 6B1-like isoform X2 n=1 Tax=Pithys albifrons albifrons TaxID=3385563 RepID=UPI003A5CD91A
MTRNSEGIFQIGDNFFSEGEKTDQEDLLYSYRVLKHSKPWSPLKPEVMISFWQDTLNLRMTRLPSPRFIVTHLRPENLPKSIFKSKAKILLLIRNPKDIAASFYHFSNRLAIFPSYETWDDFFVAFMTKKMTWGCYLEYLSKWNKYADEKNVMPITYEELKEDPVLGVKNIAAFFGISLTEEQLQLVVERSSFQSMKKNSQKTHGAFGNAFFRKGGVSDWKNLFSEDQNEKMDKAFEEHVGGTKLGRKLKYEVYCKA